MAKQPMAGTRSTDDLEFRFIPSPYKPYNCEERCWQFSIAGCRGSGQVNMTASELLDMADWIVANFRGKNGS